MLTERQLVEELQRCSAALADKIDLSGRDKSAARVMGAMALNMVVGSLEPSAVDNYPRVVVTALAVALAAAERLYELDEK